MHRWALAVQSVRWFTSGASTIPTPPPPPPPPWSPVSKGMRQMRTVLSTEHEASSESSGAHATSCTGGEERAISQREKKILTCMIMIMMITMIMMIMTAHSTLSDQL